MVYSSALRRRIFRIFSPIALCQGGEKLLSISTPKIYADYKSTSRLSFYTPSATVLRLLTTNLLIAYITSWVLWLSGASQDPRMLLPAWVSIATVSDASYSLLRCLNTHGTIDSYCSLPPYSEGNEYQERDLGVNQCIFYCQFH